MTSLFKGSWGKDPSNYWIVNLTNISEKILEEIIRQAVCKHVEDNTGIMATSQHGFIKTSSNLISSDKKISLMMGECCFNKVFHMVSH